MRCVFLFLVGVLFCACKVSEHDLFADYDVISVKNFEQSPKHNAEQKAVRDSVYSGWFFEHLIITIESNYDVILDYVYPDSVVARRSDEYFLVNVYTGEEKRIRCEEKSDKIVFNE